MLEERQIYIILYALQWGVFGAAVLVVFIGCIKRWKTRQKECNTDVTLEISETDKYDILDTPVTGM